MGRKPFTLAFAAGLGRASDQELLEAARKEDRIIITADLDYPRQLQRKSGGNRD
jgi:predicted nuclease of predicted toxin-antitoxin system